VIERIENSLDMQNLWARYQKKNDYAADANWAAVIQPVKKMNDLINVGS